MSLWPADYTYTEPYSNTHSFVISKLLRRLIQLVGFRFLLSKLIFPLSFRRSISPNVDQSTSIWEMRPHELGITLLHSRCSFFGHPSTDSKGSHIREISAHGLHGKVRLDALGILRPDVGLQSRIADTHQGFSNFINAMY